MRDPSENQGGFLTTILLIGLLLALLYLLYLIFGGNLVPTSAASSGSDPISQLVNSIRGFGRGLGDAFSRALPWP
jgi:hypothetical protein